MISTRNCPECDETIETEAGVCKHCGKKFSRAGRHQAALAASSPEDHELDKKIAGSWPRFRAVYMTKISRETIRQISTEIDVPSDLIERRLAMLAAEIYETNAEIGDAHRKYVEERAQQPIGSFREATPSLQAHTPSSGSGIMSWFIIGIVLLLILGVAIGGGESEPQTAEEKMIEDMKEGQRAVCEKWGELRPECR